MTDAGDLKVTLNADHTRLQVEVSGGPGGPRLVLSLDAPAADRFVEQLAFARASLSPPVAHELAEAAVVLGVGRPRWVAAGMETDSLSLAIRHPGLGWVQAVFPAEEAHAMAAFLMKPRQKPRLQ